MARESPSPDEVRRVLLLWIGRLGDLLVATPFFAAVRKRFPKARITAVLGEGSREFPALCADVDEFLLLRRASRPAANLALAWKLAAAPFDMLIDLNSSFSRSSAVLARLARAKVKLAFDKTRGRWAYTDLIPAPAETEHMLDRYGRLAAALGAPYSPEPTVRLAPRDLAAAKSLVASLPPGDGLLAGVHPGNFKKLDNRWPAEKFVALTDRLERRGGLRIVYLSGPGEEARVRALTSRLAKPPSAVFPPMPLGVAAALLSLLDLLIVNATGTAHLAAAVGTPTFSFLSRYTKTVWMPRSGPHHSIVSDSWESCRDIPVEAAFARLADVLKTLRPRPLPR